MKIKKLVIVLSAVLLAECTNTSQPPDRIYLDYISPGTFYGTLKQGADSVVPCVLTVSKCDSLLKAAIWNTSTLEVLMLKGIKFLPPVDWAAGVSTLNYTVSDSSSFYGDTDKVVSYPFKNLIFTNLFFTSSTDSIYYVAKRGNDTLLVSCYRK